jgi:hypothetical protein
MRINDTPEQAAKRLAITRKAFNRARSEAPQPGSYIRMEPGCAHDCPVCPLTCAVIASSLAVAEREYEEALAVTGDVLTHNGQHYSVMGGRA